MKLRSLFAASALALSMGAQAHGFQLGAIAIGHPWARATGPGQPVGAGYLSLDNQGPADRLVSASAEVGTRTEIHVMAMEGDVMRMRQVPGIDLPSKGTVKLAPGGTHLMFFGLKAPLKAGDKFPMTLQFEKAGSVTVTVNVQADAPAAAGSHAHH